MKFFLFAALISTTSAFTFVAQNQNRASSTTKLYEGKINNLVDLEAAKVVNMESLKKGEKKVYCRCWQSGTFPLCDGSHMKHNEATGDNVGPLIVSAEKEE
mmetsp:Transcript_34235/g.50327  ORF Transcript_34235/g.50327 Transcript_34235/m.50327 type:complete len:101 (-) Transcript_34235:496-798(-)|eukprot:CAMPEP_0195508266 /NCGR_PEP_ID=MMETSP0794_2-20130614/1518_1 /TAXON_ID=515487 /ORGANISM="Stephanopyxis turris, Strain CCMP 815" /LENGTH=100 /DNA_ID=CAMNT_0040635179 /DNA_START=115 /DNA_END=417 /DNA_ORIENTATION=+